MNKYTKAQDTMRPAFAALGAVGGSQMDKLLPTGTAPFLIVGAAVVLGVVLFALLDRGFDVILGNWTWLRRQICGKAWVEGDYKNIVIDKETQSIVVGGIVTIHSDNGKVRFSGESFDEKGERGNFHSLECELYSAPDLILRYTYELIHPESPSRIDIGCGLSVFIPDDPYPMRYYGDFHDSFNKGRLMIIADRITDPAELKELATTEGRYRLVSSHLKSARFRRWQKGPAIDEMSAEYPPPIASGRPSPEAQRIAAQAGLIPPPTEGSSKPAYDALPGLKEDGKVPTKKPST